MAGSAGTLKKCGDRLWRAELANQIDISNIDAEFQRRGRDQRLELPRFQPLFRR